MKELIACRSRMQRTLALLLILMLAAPQWLIAAVRTPELPPEPHIGAISEQQEMQLGLKAAQQVYQQFPVLSDSDPVAQYVRQLGQRLVSTLPANPWHFDFHVVQEKDINAFALPGGPMFVNIGTITAADNEAQLAGVMAHEMSHVWMRHSAQMAVKQSEAQGIAGILGALLGNGVVGSLGRLGLSLGAGSLLLKYSRGDESQADAVGAIIMYKAGYNPQAMADFFKKIEQEGGSRGPQFLSDHPNPGNRESAIQKEIANWPAKQYRGSVPEFQQAKSRAAGIKAYTAQEIAQRAKSGGWNSAGGPRASSQAAPGPMAPTQVSASSNFQTLEHQAFTMQYPDNWKVYGDPQSAVTIAPEGGISQDAVAYGVLVNKYQPRRANSLSSATQELVDSIRQENPDLRKVGSDQAINVNGVQGRSVDLLGNSPVQQNGRAAQERDWLVSLPQQDGSLLYFVFVAPEHDFSQLRPIYERMLRSVRVQ